MAQLCILMGIRHSPRTPYSPWTSGLVEVQNKALVLVFECSFKTLLKDGHTKSVCTISNSQLVSALNVSPHEVVVLTRTHF